MTEVAKHKNEEFTLKEKIFYTAGSIAVAFGTFFLGRKLFRTAVSNREEKKTFSEDSPATYAKQIKMAFENDGWPGTNTTELRRLIIEIPSKHAVTQVANSYQKLYSSPLYKEMSDELQSTEYNEMLAIINAKPDRIEKKKKGTPPSKPGTKQYEEWAKRSKAAFDKSYGPFPGTDEEALKAVFDEIPTQADFVQVAAHYKVLYTKEFLSDLKDEVGSWDYHDWMKIILQKPKQ